MCYNEFYQIDGLIRKRHKSSAIAVELRVFCIDMTLDLNW